MAQWRKQQHELLHACVRRGEQSPLPLSSWATLPGYRERWRRTISGLKSMYTLAKCRKHIAGGASTGLLCYCHAAVNCMLGSGRTPGVLLPVTPTTEGLCRGHAYSLMTHAAGMHCANEGCACPCA